MGALAAPGPVVPGRPEPGVVDGVGDSGVGGVVIGAGLTGDGVSGAGTIGTGAVLGRGAGAAPGITGAVGGVGEVVGVGALGVANGIVGLGAPEGGGVVVGTVGVGTGAGGGVSGCGTWLSGAGAMFVPGEVSGVVPAGPLPTDEVPYEGDAVVGDPKPPGGEANPPVAGIEDVCAMRGVGPAGAGARVPAFAQVQGDPPPRWLVPAPPPSAALPEVSRTA